MIDIGFRLVPLLDELGIKVRGVQMMIEKETSAAGRKVTRQKVRAMITGSMGKITLRDLSAVCDWLAEKGIDPARLPGALIAQTELFERICHARRLKIYLGYRKVDPAAQHWISRRDSEVANDIIREVSRRPHSPRIEYSYVHQQAGLGAAEPFEELWNAPPVTASIIIGSPRVNPIVEHLVARCFKDARPLEPQSEVATVPFFQVLRANVKVDASCFGAKGTPPGVNGNAVPGTYHLDGEGEWIFEPCIEDQSDAGLVITIWDAERERIVVALFGYSGSATRVIGWNFCDRPHVYWPPNAKLGLRQVGVYLCRVRLHHDGQDLDLQNSRCDVVPIHTGILEKYLATKA